MKYPNDNDGFDDELKQQQQDDDLLQKLKAHLLSYYTPAYKPGADVIMMSTAEIWQQLQDIYRNEILYSQGDVARWLNEGAFTFFDAGNMRLEWMLKRASGNF